MKNVVRIALTAALLLTGAAAVAAGPTADEGKPAGAEFSIKATPVKLTIDKAGNAVITIAASPGFHWNKDYPAQAVVDGADPKTVKVAKREFKQLSGDFEATETTATVKIPVVGKAAGEEQLTVNARFSVCNESMCLIKKASVEVPLAVAK
ncbi:MAG: hypothetical protein H6745_27310 [Deltaproteobacteria bacterium]|nr:hypothetical protein [Deltaproteobacteria bacterium]